MAFFWVVLGWMQPTTEIRRNTAATAGIFIVDREVVPVAAAGGVHSSAQISEAGFQNGYCHFNFAAPVLQHQPLRNRLQAQDRGASNYSHVISD